MNLYLKMCVRVMCNIRLRERARRAKESKQWVNKDYVIKRQRASVISCLRPIKTIKTLRTFMAVKLTFVRRVLFRMFHYVSSRRATRYRVICVSL